MEKSKLSDTSAPPFPRPTRMMTLAGDIRRVGYEFEFAGVDLQKSAKAVQDLFGGRVETDNRFSLRVVDTKWGEFGIESDASILKTRRYSKYMKELGFDPDSSDIGHRLEKWLAEAAEDLVPFEIVTPPIPMDHMECMDLLREALREAGAQGTKAHVYAAYGMQFNPEMPDFSVETMLAYMRSFLLLYDRLSAMTDVPFARRFLPYIDPFPEKYFEHALDADYSPDRETFIRDYLEFNPTRNRPLDWLPLFAYLDRDLVMSFDVERELIKPRPTLHYRLPSCLIDDPQWTIRREWEKWMEVEELSVEPERITAMSGEWFELHSPLTLRAESKWLARSEEWVQGRHE